MRFLYVLLVTFTLVSCDAAKKGESKSTVTKNESGEQVRTMTIQVADTTLEGSVFTEETYATAQGLDDAGNVVAFSDGKTEAPVKIKPTAFWIIRDTSPKYYADLYRFQLFEFELPIAATGWKIDFSKLPGRTCAPDPASGKVTDVPDTTNSVIKDSGNDFSITGNCTINYSEKLSGTVTGLKGDLVLTSGESQKITITSDNQDKTFETEAEAPKETDAATMSDEEIGKITEFDQFSSIKSDRYEGGGTSKTLRSEVKIDASPSTQNCTIANGTKDFEIIYSRFVPDYKDSGESELGGRYYYVAGPVYYRKYLIPTKFDDLAITCEDKKFSMGGNVSGQTGALVVTVGDKTVNIDATATKYAADGLLGFKSYTVSITTAPAGQTCTVAAAGTTTSLAANVTTADITCTSNSYTLGGTVSGLTSGSLTLRDFDAPTANKYVTITADGAFQFPGTRGSGYSYQIDLITNTSGKTCTLTNDLGTLTGNVTNITVTCM